MNQKNISKLIIYKQLSQHKPEKSLQTLLMTLEEVQASTLLKNTKKMDNIVEHRSYFSEWGDVSELRTKESRMMVTRAWESGKQSLKKKCKQSETQQIKQM